MGRLLTFNCHEAYVHLLGKLGLPMDIIDGLPGRYTASWDERMRPVPALARLVRLDEALADARYDVAIAHNLSDLLALRSLALPKILVLHVDLRARVREEPGPHDVALMQGQVRQYLSSIGAVAVAVSKTKAESWGQACSVIAPGVDPDEYDGYHGSRAVALRVANQVLARRERFAWDAHLAIVAGHPSVLVGHNPGLPGAAAASSWDDLRQHYREHRAYVHTAGLGLDDGYNLGVVEAMMTGMPIVSLALPESPVRDGVNGYVSEDLAYLNARLGELLGNREHAQQLGRRARESAREQFSLSAFVRGWHAAIAHARDAFTQAAS
jgi:glycosyltransferase involved in cell wall biosynthesis